MTSTFPYRTTVYPAVRQHAKPTNKAWCHQRASGVRRTALTSANSVQRTERNVTVTRELHVGSVISAGYKRLILCPSFFITRHKHKDKWLYSILHYELWWQQCTKYRLQLKCDCTRWRTEGEVKRKLANGVGSQYSSHYRWCAQLGC